ncbi:energy coupling factor transporter S component ThiW [Ruoffia tabacinasalis]|uniref:Energy coupling factor transporter S component ThiW n=1 Tax=Ruoffia tabacinasalis TaxID=87458 RepID=A0A5R9DUJ1_9LACT|nr:energy coupling factor transporter S component ThiW [Ruoffia tabacinasalis]TLQ40897.1 energy coupling factor transporter S component ThiW [Ruoffia tabacinasalis]
MKSSRTQKLVLAGILSGLAVVGSLLSFPILGSRAAPVQHIINIICAVLLGPSYGVAVAFIASLLRNLFGLGTIMAFPGSMIGAFLCGLIFAKTKSLFLTSLGEIIGTGILGGLVAWPLAILFLGESVGTLAFYAYVIPFLISTITGTVIAVGIINILKQNGRINWLERSDRPNDRD